MNPEAAKLLIGIDVLIRRSDGREHSATVKSVNAAKSMVEVNWIEEDEPKAKYINMREICKRNPNLIPYLQPPVPSTSNWRRPNAEKDKKMKLPLKLSKIPLTTESAPPAPPPEEPGLPSYQRRQAAKPPSHRLPTIEAVSESETSKRASVAPPNPRLSRVPDVFSISTKNPETQTKKGKYGSVNRPNKQFYQMMEYREKIPLTLADPVELHRFCVCVRKRPLNIKELTKKEIDVVSIPANGVLLLNKPEQVFRFDCLFDEHTSNDSVYRLTAKPLVKSIFEGGRATCFAYGQTGSGKTHTMGGDFSGKPQNSSKGIYALAAQDVFLLLQQKRYTGLDLCPYVTFFEIYNGKVFDLLNKKEEPLVVLEDENQQVQVVGLQEMPVSSVEDVIKMIKRGSSCRTSGKTFANANSSRSHAVLQVILRLGKQLYGKFSLVDLAGNIRGTDVSSNDQQTMVETAEINLSLLALKECIRSLRQNSEHIPFRRSKLTQVLRDSFIGENSRTCMIAMISPGMSSYDYTLNTLQYAERVKELNGAYKRSGTGEHGVNRAAGGELQLLRGRGQSDRQSYGTLPARD